MTQQVKKTQNVYIYVLKLKDNKYYVGRTNNPKMRLDSHYNANGSEWTKKYPPVKKLRTFKAKDLYDEDKYTKYYMSIYGIDNVRGGTYSRLFISNEERNFILKEMKNAQNACFECGQNHFIKNCPIVIRRYNQQHMNKWYMCESFDDMLKMQLKWINNEINEFPIWSPFDKTNNLSPNNLKIKDHLVTMNKKGLFYIFAQDAEEFESDDKKFNQRSFITGIMNSDDGLRLFSDIEKNYKDLIMIFSEDKQNTDNKQNDSHNYIMASIDNETTNGYNRFDVLIDDIKYLSHHVTYNPSGITVELSDKLKNNICFVAIMDSQWNRNDYLWKTITKLLK